MGWWLGLAPVTLEFWVRFPNERNQGKQAHPVLKCRVPQGSQCWADSSTQASERQRRSHLRDESTIAVNSGFSHGLVQMVRYGHSLVQMVRYGPIYCIRNNFCQSSNLAVQNGFISRGSSGLPQLFRVAELRGGPSTSFGVFATLSLYRYSLLCTYCTNSRRRFDSARRDRAENCNCSCGEGCGGRAVAARRARRSRDTANSVLPEMKKWLTAGAKSGNLGESSTALETVTRERIQSVSQQFFTEIWGLGESRQRGAPSYEYKKRVEARDALVKAFLEQYDTAKAPTGDSGIEIKSRMKMQVHGWWNSSEQAASLRKDNKWGADGTVAVSGRQKPCLPAGGCAAPVGDQQTPQECQDVDAETVKYGYKDPSLDLLRRSYLHLWDKTGDHIGWRNWSAHSDKCREAGIDSLPERTFYRRLDIEKTAHAKPKPGDEQLDFLHRPIRHQSQISGFLERVRLIGFRHKTQYRQLSLF
jgi:hypothetical protein